MGKPPILEIGEFRIAFLTDGYWRNDGGCMFGVVPRELWSREHPADERNRIRLNLTCPLIMRGADAILVDCGIGNRLSAVERKIFDHGDGWLHQGLAALGIQSGDVTAVVLSHAHFDHCGGMARRRESGAMEAAFPRARYFIQRGELETAQSSRNERLRAAYRHIEECIAPLRGKIEAISGDTAIVAGVTAKLTGGHTRDHQVIEVRAGADSFIHLADIVPTRSHLRGPWNQSYDLDALRTMEVKARYLVDALRDRSWISFAHDDRFFAAQIANDRGKLVLANTIGSPVVA